MESAASREGCCFSAADMSAKKGLCGRASFVACNSQEQVIDVMAVYFAREHMFIVLVARQLLCVISRLCSA